MAGVAGVYSLL